MRLAVDWIVAMQQMDSRLDVDDDLDHGIRRNRKMARSNRLDEKARAEVEWSRRHDASANLSGGGRMMRGVGSAAQIVVTDRPR